MTRMAYYDNVKSVLFKADATVGATNSSFRVLEAFFKKTKKEKRALICFSIKFNKDRTSLIFDYVDYDCTTSNATIGTWAELPFDKETNKWNQSLILTCLTERSVKTEQVLWDEAKENKREEEKRLKAIKIKVYKGKSSGSDDDHVTTQAQFLKDVKFIHDFTLDPNFVSFYLKQKNPYLPDYYVGFDNFYYLYAKMKDCSSPIVATISLGSETNRIEGTGIKIIR